jgi:hypothetical protein
MGTFTFWHRWLLGISILNILIGLAIAFFPNSFLFAAHTAAIEDTFFQGGLSAEAADLRTFLFGIIGGTLAGYFVLQTWIVRVPFSRREPWAWHAVTWALVLWFVVDTAMSIAHGAVFNVWMINVGSALLIGLPLVMTYRDFHETKVRQ